MEKVIENLMYRSRWLLAPIYLGLSLAVLALGIKFFQELIHLLFEIHKLAEADMVLIVLSLIDIAMVGGLLVMVMMSGYENFVSKIGTGDHEDRPAWMGRVGFSDLKIKLMGAIVAISAVELLKAFINVDEMTWQQLAWKVGIHITFVVSGVLFAITDRLTENRGGSH